MCILTIVFDLGGVLIDWDRRYLYSKMFNGHTREIDYFLEHICSLPWHGEMDAGRAMAEAIAAKTESPITQLISPLTTRVGRKW